MSSKSTLYPPTTRSGTERLKQFLADLRGTAPPGSIASSGSMPYPNSTAPHAVGVTPNLSGTAVIPSIGSAVPGHYGSHPSVGTPLTPHQRVMFPPPNAPDHQVIPAHLLRLPDTVAEKLRLCGAIVIYQANSPEYRVVISQPHYSALSVPHDADADMWAQAMKYLVQKANRAIEPAAQAYASSGNQVSIPGY